MITIKLETLVRLGHRHVVKKSNDPSGLRFTYAPDPKDVEPKIMQLCFRYWCLLWPENVKDGILVFNTLAGTGVQKRLTFDGSFYNLDVYKRWLNPRNLKAEVKASMTTRLALLFVEQRRFLMNSLEYLPTETEKLVDLSFRQILAFTDKKELLSIVRGKKKFDDLRLRKTLNQLEPMKVDLLFGLSHVSK